LLQKDRLKMRAAKRHAQCGTKRQWATEAEATSALRETLATSRRRHKYDRRAALAYQCKHCNFWHWGHH
jgi:hypothetical protein